VEPFAGAAGYATRYPDHKIILVDKYPVIVGIWRYLIRTSSREILSIPEVEAVADLPSWVPQEARDLVGFWMNAAVCAPRARLSAGRKKLAGMGRKFEGWTPATRQRIAEQVDKIRHWCVIEGSYDIVPNFDHPVTWFVDPPYDNDAGAHYVHASVDYLHLGAWCSSRHGQVIVCENEGATWLPFQPFRTLKAGVNNTSGGSREVVWYGDT
jgi:hypothetical protein